MDNLTRRDIQAHCVDLIHAFSFHLDRKDYRALADLFAPEGVFIRTGVPLTGPQQIFEVMSQRPAEQFSRHVTTNTHFTAVSPDRAQAVSYNLSFFSSPESALPLDYQPQKAMLLDFIDTFTATPAGWRFLLRDARALLIPAEMRAQLNAASRAGH